MADFQGLLKAGSSIEFRDKNGNKRSMWVGFEGVPVEPGRDPSEQLADLVMNANGVAESSAASLQ